MNPKLCALATVIVLVFRAHVPLGPGLSPPLAAVLLVITLALAAAGAWLAIRLARGFRSSAAWRPVARPARARARGWAP